MNADKQAVCMYKLYSKCVLLLLMGACKSIVTSTGANHNTAIHKQA